jgi:hypothetical protein
MVVVLSVAAGLQTTAVLFLAPQRVQRTRSSVTALVQKQHTRIPFALILYSHDFRDSILEALTGNFHAHFYFHNQVDCARQFSSLSSLIYEPAECSSQGHGRFKQDLLLII